MIDRKDSNCARVGTKFELHWNFPYLRPHSISLLSNIDKFKYRYLYCDAITIEIADMFAQDTNLISFIWTNFGMQINYKSEAEVYERYVFFGCCISDDI